MNHEYIEIEFTETKDGKRVVIRYQDRAEMHYSIQEFDQFVRVYRATRAAEGDATYTFQRSIPWHRIWEIRYYGER